MSISESSPVWVHLLLCNLVPSEENYFVVSELREHGVPGKHSIE
jgi:hypothetical protein